VAIGALTDNQLLKLKDYAEYKIEVRAENKVGILSESEIATGARRAGL